MEPEVSDFDCGHYLLVFSTVFVLFSENKRETEMKTWGLYLFHILDGLVLLRILSCKLVIKISMLFILHIGCLCYSHRSLPNLIRFCLLD